MAARLIRNSQHNASDDYGARIAMTWVKACLLGLASLGLAALLFLQALPQIDSRQSLALCISDTMLSHFASADCMSSGANGIMIAQVQQGMDLSGAAKAGEPLAERAFRASPLVPGALAIIALAHDDPGKASAILDQALKISRRDLSLQGAALQAFTRDHDFKKTLAVVDNILRVHPEQKSLLLPQMVTALEDARSVPAFAQMLNMHPEWAGSFLTAAAADPKLLDNLLAVRQRVTDTDKSLLAADRALMKRMIASGRMEAAAGIYQQLAGRDIVSEVGRVDWADDYAPFDWSFTDRADLRAEAVEQGEVLAIYMREGHGGILAKRLLRLPTGQYRIRAEYAGDNGASEDALRLEAQCPDKKKSLFRSALGDAASQVLDLSDETKSCRYVELIISGRAVLGTGNYRGSIDKLIVIRL